MIKFHDPSGAPHFGQATITRTTSVNGGLSLTGEVFAGGDVLNGLDYGWWLNFDNEKYVITYKKLSDDTNTVVFDAVQQFFWDFAKVALHAQYTGSHEYTFYLGQLFDKSGYTYKNDVTVPAFEKENWGYKNKLDLFNDIIDQAGVEFEVHNETVHIAKQIGSDLTNFVRKGINLSDLTEEMKISDFATYARGYGAFKDDQDQSKGRLEVEYRSELAKKFGDLEMDPIVDERYTVADNLIAALKKQVDATYTVSMTMNIYDLESAGYPNYESPKVGDWILAIDEALNFERKIRIIQLEEQFDVTGKRIGYTATCGDLSIVDQYTYLQSSLDSKVQRIQESVDAAATSANGKNTNYYGAKEPVSANEGDLWFDQSNSDPDKWSIKQWVNGRWEQITLNPGEIDAKVNVAKQEAETAVENAKSASDKADQLASKYDDTNSLASQAMRTAVSAQGAASDAVAAANSTAADFGKVSQKTDSAVASALNAQSAASSAVAAANSTASEFGKVSQKTDSAVASALNAQSNASDAVKQASSAAADSKDAKQIAGAVSQSYKTLTDGSTMTIAELESGLAVKLTKTDLDGYATQTWTQNQVKMTADGINGTMSSIKSTVDGQTTSINDLKADSSSFKSQFTTVNNTLGKQTTDIGSLQATSKELTTGFNTLTSDNTTNKNDISQLKQTSTELSSTMTTVQTQVQNSAVGTNLLKGTGDHIITGTGAWTIDYLSNETTDNLLPLFKGLEGQTVTVSVDYEYSGFVAGSGQNRIGWETEIDADIVSWNGAWYYPNNDSGSGRISRTFVVPKNITRVGESRGYIQLSGSGTGILSHLKLEKGSMATDWCPNPADNASVTAFSKLSQTVDGMKIDISKKIEQSDLNGYATETWTQNQIQVSADGINGTISSIKSTVDGQTTSINDLKADSSSFKSQFTTVNDTLGKQTTDIGTLQATSKELTTGFNTLTSYNTTNKNDISQLKQTSTELSSTMTTVQTQVQNSAVGTNLLKGTGDHAVTNTGKPYVYGYLSNETTDDLLTLFKGLEGQTVTVSVDYEYSGFVAGSYNNRLGFEIKIVADTTNYFGTWYYPNNDSGSGRLSKTFVVPKNITEIGYANGYVQLSGSGIGILSHLKLEKGSMATDWCPNPADNASVTAVSKLSQTVDGMKLDISKKIEHKDLNGYATQTWAQTQIKTTADGINGTISSVKGTVDSHTTSINTLQTDSNGFKSQFTKVNNTLGEHTTDIGTLKTSSKELSSNFSSLSTDNNTNKNDISQLKQTATEVSSTLETVQAQVQNSAVGTNLLTGTGSHTVTGTKASDYLSNETLEDMLALFKGLEGQTVTVSFDYEYLGFVLGSSQNRLGWEIRASADTTRYFGPWYYPDNDSGSGRMSSTFVVPKNITSIGYATGYIQFSGSGTATLSHLKLEKGSLATDWCPNPSETATITALSSISQTVDTIQTTVRGKVDNDTYQSKMTQLDNQITTKVSQGDITNENILPYSGYWSDLTGWTLMSWGAADRNLNLIHHNFYHNAVDATLCVGTAMADTAAAGSTKFNVIPNTTYTMTFWGFASSNVKGTNVYVLGRTFASTKDYDYVHNVQKNLIMSPSGINKYTATFTTNSDETQAYVRLDNQGSTNGQSSGAYFAELKIERGSVATPYTRVSSGEIQVTSDNINLKVSKDGVINAINISNEGTTIYGNKLHITAATYIDKATIKDAMIASLSANKLTAGSINAANINVYNINGSKIVANSITADKLQAGSMLIAMNSTLQTLKIGTDGLYTTDRSGNSIGRIHTNRSVQHPENWGLDFDLDSDGKFMSWGAKNEGDPNGDYGIKFGWTRNSAASDFGMPWGGFWFNDNVVLHKNLRFDGGGIDVNGAYQLMKFAWISMNGIKYPFFGSSNLKAGWLFGSHETYLVRDGGVINASKVLGALNGQNLMVPTKIRSDGTIAVYTTYHL
ncbi:phage tail protein [Lactiplantibacillus plantarum subsp. plantarum]|uniref:phage tail protein n=1 Tax=Lactiplantibacillus plantarum TaxID=1590 RepID=UPI003F819CDB